MDGQIEGQKPRILASLKDDSWKAKGKGRTIPHLHTVV